MNFSAELNQGQYDAAVAGDGAHLVLAGAGTGKTRVIVYRLAWLLSQGIEPENIMLLTFTNKAAKEMMSRAETLLGRYPGKLWAGTFHSVANRLLRAYGRETAFGAFFSLLDEDDSRELFALCVKETGVKTPGKKFPSPAVLANVWSYARNARVDIATALERRAGAFEDIVQQIQVVVDAYEQAKLRQRSMDFDDLLIKALELLSRPELRMRIASQFRHVLVDEFQDTNLIQADIVYALQSVHGNVTVVGDDAQSIYSFRAARIENILAFTTTYPQAQTHRLVVNYRSTPEILALANAVIGCNARQFPKDLIAHRQSGPIPCVIACSDGRAEAKEIAMRINGLVARGVRHEDIAVLFRSTFHSQHLEFELLNRNIAYDYRGGMKFFERAHIKDALAYLRVLVNMQDIIAWVRVTSLHQGIGASTALSLARQMSVITDIATALQTPVRLGVKAQQGWRACSALIQRMLDAGSPAQAIRVLMVDTAYREYLTAEYENARERRDDLDQFARFAEEYRDISTFLDAVTLTGDFGGLTDIDMPQAQTSFDPNRIVLSTIHQAKGLEWEHVFIVHAAEGLFPSEKAYDDEYGIEEERRLFYVAVTRAKTHLTITYPLSGGYDAFVLRAPSQFLQEISRQLFTQRSLPAFGASRPLTVFNKKSVEDGDGDFYEEQSIDLT
jgi:DNA helicase-2/ATP-dependent DNA helicase PcrA